MKIVTALVIVALLVGGFFGYRHYQNAARLERNQRFYALEFWLYAEGEQPPRIHYDCLTDVRFMPGTANFVWVEYTNQGGVHTLEKADVRGLTPMSYKSAVWRDRSEWCEP
jgi:hypothetical protein